MIYYIILLSMILIAAYVSMAPVRNKQVDIVSCYIFGIVLFVLAAFRNNVGYDYQNYKLWYDFARRFQGNFMNVASSISVEWGFLFLMMIMPSYRMLVFSIAAAAVALKTIYINKEADARMVCMIIYFMGIFLFCDMGVIRQGLSISVLLYSIKYAINKDIVKFGLLILLASLFHVTALLFIPMYFIADHKYTKKQYYIVAGVSMALFIRIRSDIVIKVAKSIPVELLRTKVVYYATLYHKGILERITYTTMLKRILVLILFVELLNRKNNDEKTVFYLNAYTLSIFIMGLCRNLNAIFAGRGTQALYFMQTFLFAKIMHNTKKTAYRFALLMLIIFLFAPNFLNLLGEDSPYLPYTM